MIPNSVTPAAAIDSILSVALDGSAHVDADKVLSIAGNDTGLTFITGDLMLSGLDNIRNQFKKTYAGLASQHQTIDQKRVRLIAPDGQLLLGVVTAMLGAPFFFWLILHHRSEA